MHEHPQHSALLDRFIGEIDKAINVLLAARARSARPLRTPPGGELELEAAERLESARLMRVNHSGEVAAQALYRGQALTARDSAAADAMRQAAAEEMDHLAWCEQPARRVAAAAPVCSIPLWYAGSFLIGSLAGALGDRASLGFVSETERQVESHLRDHLDRLPAADERSRAIVEQMTHDESEHGAKPLTSGARSCPFGSRGRCV